MKKRKSTRETKNMIQTALWLPRDVHEKLKREGGERGLGDKIRRLIDEAMAAADAAQTPDKITGALLDQIKDVASNLSSEEPLWANRALFEVFRVAVNGLLDGHQPRTEATPEAWAKLKAIYGDDRPEVIGLIIARHTMYAYDRERYGGALLDKLKDRKFVDKLREASHAARTYTSAGRRLLGNQVRLGPRSHDGTKDNEIRDVPRHEAKGTGGTDPTSEPTK